MFSPFYLFGQPLYRHVLQPMLRGARTHKLRIIAIVVTFLLASPLPAPALTSLAQRLLPTTLADATTGLVRVLLPQPTPVAAAGLDPVPADWVVLGNRLWLEDDFDGDATTGLIKPVGAGYVVSAVASDGVTVYTAVTTAKGFYTLSVPPYDTYTVTAVQPPGMVDTPIRASNGNNPVTNDNRNHNRLGTTVVVTETDNLSIDFGFYYLIKHVALGDRLWLEDDNDGDATTGTVTPVGAGHVVTALASDGQTSYTGITDADGYYIILVPEYETYQVTTNPPLGVVDTPIFTANGSNPALMNNKNHQRTGTTVVITETDNLSIDFGFFTHTSQPTVNLGNYVWFDINEDGIQNEPPNAGREGITVTLTYSNGATATTVTTAGGYYTFTNLLPNQPYTVQFVLPAGYRFTTQQQGGNTSLDSNPAADGRATVTLGTVDNYTIDAGFIPAVTVGDRVWYDYNHDGHQADPVSEPGVPGVVATIYHALTNQPVLSHGVPLTAVTDNNGVYLFANLPPGAYFVIFSNLPAGYTPTLLNVGDDASDSDADATGRTPATPALDGGEEDRTLDMGIWQVPASLGDWVWEDLNSNGVQEPGEPGLPGVTVTLQGPTGSVTTSTDSTGYYTFTNLSPGMPYTLTFATPIGYLPTLANSGSSEANDSEGGLVFVSPLQPGEHNPTLDSGFVRLQPDLVLTKAISGGAEHIQPGAILTYTLTYHNQGNLPAIGAVITETVSVYTTFVAQASTTGWSCSNGAGAGTPCLFAVDTVPPGASGVLIFAIKINALVPPGTAITNLATISADSTQVEGVFTNNMDEVTVMIASPTGLPEEQEPALGSYRLYLPVINQ